MGCAGNVAWMGEMGNAFRVLVRISEERSLLERYCHRSNNNNNNNNNKMDVTENNSCRLGRD
jgi:hypothetical protein